MLPRLKSSAFFLCVLGGAAALWLHGCEGSVGPCSGDDCPPVPGCEGDKEIICGPAQVCTEQVCEGVGWICGVDSSGNYAWLRSAAPCDDGDACTVNDICSGGLCWGTPLECKTPPANSCVDGVRLKVYAGLGTCSGGQCSYTHSTVTCPGKCLAGKCDGSPCVGVKCDTPPGECYKSPGTCAAGKCSYLPQNKGTACGVKDKCYSAATCDGAGKCLGTKVDCARPNTTGGVCVAGNCQGFQCTAGYGNCNTTWNDGCEMKLTSTAHCGKCGLKCGNVPHGTPACSGGKCVVGSCSAPYKDCDRVYSNGCELPEGVANGCNKSGLTYAGSGAPTGCGTPWCGSKSGGTAYTRFGTWTCVFCVKCHYFPDGWSWCLSSGSNKGNFSTARCPSCCNSSYQDLVCK